MEPSGPDFMYLKETVLFDSPLYDPKAKWRTEPVAEAQLGALGLTVSSAAGVTKGVAAELISRSLPISSTELAFLKYFDASLPENATQLDAYCAIAKIITNPANRNKWDARPATQRERLFIEYMEGAKAAQNATSKDAADKFKTYTLLASMRAKYSRCLEWLQGWQKVEDAHNWRESFIADHCDSLARDPEAYGLQRVDLDLVRKAIELLEIEQGKSLAVLEQEDWFYLKVADAMRRLDPSVSPNLSRALHAIHCPWITETNI